MKYSNLSGRLGLLAALFVLFSFSGCAQDVEDIDRTQPNFSAKEDFEGVWYFRQTITEVPNEIDYTFAGFSSDIEKIRWDIRENYLIAYRSYEYQPGTDPDAGRVEAGETQLVEGEADNQFDPTEYREDPIAAFQIISHFDVQRQYNPSTGEQTNVISENMSDRPWHERDYMRVDWSMNLINSLDFFTDMNRIGAVNYFVQDVEGGKDAFYSERRSIERDGESVDELGYFDFVNKISLEPNLRDCWYFDVNCIPAEIKIRNSFYRLKDIQRDYEPAFYDDRMMNKFGYFRSERKVYDRREGFTDDKRLYFADRHDIWKNDFKRDPETGEYLRDARGDRIPTPMSQREPKPVVYYLSQNFPEEVAPAADQIGEDWDASFTRAVAAAKGMSEQEVADTYGPMFVVCDNPVQQDNNAACDPRPVEDQFDGEGNYIPFSPRIGDLRYSFLWWVDSPQARGPLGYGPPFGDPETGEIISGTAYVYGAAVDSYAQYGVDIVKLANGDYDDSELRAGLDVKEYLQDNLRSDIDPRARIGEEGFEILDDVPLEGVESMLTEKMQGRLQLIKENPANEVFDPGIMRHQQILEKFERAGWDKRLVDSEMLNALTAHTGRSAGELSDDEVDELLERINPLKMRDYLRRKQEFRDLAAENNVYLAEFADPAVVSTALQFEGEDDYEKIWNEIRRQIFHGVGAHEVGHSIGLRHNFQGSYDALNYFDRYWELREENLPSGPPASIGDFYVLSEMTETQREENMRAYQYSSIMDYHSRFNGDWQGVGKYDDAAILFAYTFGTYKDIGVDNDQPFPQEAGYVEVFEEGAIPNAQRQLFRQYDTRTSPADRTLLENWHYSTIMQRLGNDPDVLKKRKLMRFSKLEPMIREGQEDRPTQVPYMFCSDEIAGALISCNRWDLGADPMEIVKSARDDYFTYYPITHFRRNRVGFDPIGPLNRSYRTMRTFLTVYQQWLIGNQDVDDDLLNTYYVIAMSTGFNEMVKLMTMPRYGTFAENDEGVYEWQSYDMDGAGDVQIPMGEGRRLRSLYDSDSGYYYFDRLLESGHFWDWFGAMLVAIEPVARTVAVDTAADREAYLVPFYLVFEDQLTELFNGSIHDDLRRVQPRMDGDGNISYPPSFRLTIQGTDFDPETGAPVDVQGAEIEVDYNLTQQRYASLFGIAYFNELYTQHFVDQARAFKIGNGEQLEAGSGSDYEVYTMTDPGTGVTYGALRPTSPGPDYEPGLGVTLIDKGRAILNEDPELSDASNQFEFQQLVDTINMVDEIIEVYGGAL